MRVGLIGPLPPPSGGMANQTRQLGELLASERAVVTVVQVNAPYRPHWLAGVPVLRSLARLLPYLLALRRTAGKSEIFHVMANSGWSWHLFAVPAIWVGRLRGVAVVVNYRGGEAEAFLGRSGRMVSFSMRRANALVVPSAFLHGVFSKFAMHPEIVPNIVDLGRFRPRDPVRTGEPHLLVARNLEPLYDNETAIRALEILRQTFPGARLTIAGSGPQLQQLSSFAQARGLAASVTFAGRLEPFEMSALYRSADILLNPSLADNMPNSILEAWSCGVPVVSTNVGGIPFMARDGVNASLVPPTDPTAMAQACAHLLCDGALWDQRAQAGLAEAQRYTWACVQPVLHGIYCRSLAKEAA